MIAEFQFEHGKRKVDLNRGIDLSDAFTDQGDGPLAWGIEHPRFTPVRKGDFVGSVQKGGAVNFRDLCLNPHGNGTHTECLGHITETVYSINQLWENAFHPATLIEIEPEILNETEFPREKGDRVILPEQLEAKLHPSDKSSALIIRSNPYPGGRPRDYSGSNPPYFHPEATRMIREKGFKHLLTDLPSVDKENDDGALEAHRSFWKLPEEPAFDHYITELIKVPEGTKEGHYVLELQLAPVENDAAPSRPVIFPLFD